MHLQYMGRRILLVGVVIAAFGSGYGIRAWRGASVSALTASNEVDVDSLVAIQSFSEIENAKAMLSGLCDEFLSDMSMRRATLGQTMQLRDLEQGIKEFSGTEEELNLVRLELWLLRTQQRYNQWLDVYLQTLYEHPTHKLVGALAEDAISIGRASGRQDEVMNALNHLTCIPLTFATKRQVECAMTCGAPGSLVAHAE